MSRPTRFEEFRWLGDKDRMRVHDLDNTGDPCAIDDLMKREAFASFGPDILPEARNRGYKPCPHCVPDDSE
ncbi:MAG: hypothetical protein QOG03_1267 [Actinomycetota bacterium]|jgi:hypothetical protein|nr:hypothetical protein [Actinomycetota bacterium]